MHIGPYVLPNAVFVAPMAGVTDRPFRQLCRQFGAGYAVSEMVTSRKDLWKSLKTSRRANHDGEPGPIAVQIAGTDAPTMAEAALALATASPTELTGRITYSLELLAELQRPTFTLDGTEELTDWAPATLPARIAIMKAHSRGEREGQEASNVPDLLKTLRD